MELSPLSFFKCLADETRLTTVLLLEQEGELCVCELMSALEVSQPKISRHLALMRESVLLTDRREGQWVYYSINSNIPGWVVGILAGTLADNLGLLSAPLKRMSMMGNRPQRKQNCC